jgi:hypothetical protein
MCAGKIAGAVLSPIAAVTGLGKKLLPKTPKLDPVVERQAERLPDGGDPYMRFADRNGRRLMTSTSIFTNQKTLGMPGVSGAGRG